MKVLVKLGGTLLDDPASLAQLAQQLVSVAGGHELVVVHGGGKQVTRHLADRGIQSEFINGLRVSDAAVIQAVTQVIAGSVNKQLVSAMNAAGSVRAVGISGVDGVLTSAVALSPRLQFVGYPVQTDPRLLNAILAGGFIPVVACIAGDAAGSIFNVNADAMAVSCAMGWQAQRILFLTDVTGVRDGTGTVLPSLTNELVGNLVLSGVAYGGMQAKLTAARQAVRAGIQIDIASGAEPNIVSRLLAGEAIGSHWPAGQVN